jgi:hypothetical protein
LVKEEFTADRKFWGVLREFWGVLREFWGVLRGFWELRVRTMPRGRGKDFYSCHINMSDFEEEV